MAADTPTPVEALATSLETTSASAIGAAVTAERDTARHLANYNRGISAGCQYAARAIREQLAPQWAALHEAAAEMLAYIEGDDSCAPAVTLSVTVAAWREAVRASRADGGPPATETRPDGFRDFTCGSCGEVHSTNFTEDEVECPECGARRCPCCQAWFGGDRG